MLKLRKQQTNVTTRNLIISKYKKNKNISKIARDLELKYQTVYSIIQRNKNENRIKNKTKNGRPKKLDNRANRRIVREIKKDRRQTLNEITNTINKTKSISVSSKTVRRLIKKTGLNARVARKKPFISLKNQKGRKKWAQKYGKWSLYKWKKIIWSDECSVENDPKRRVLVWRRAGEEWETSCLRGTVKSGRFSISIWGCIGWNGIGPVRVIDGRMNQHKYIEILSNIKDEMYEKFGANAIFMDDNAPVHRAASVTKWKEDNKIETIDWVPQSPDLNVIENVWSQLKREISKTGPIVSNKELLKKRILDCWNLIDTNSIRTLIKSMPKRCQLVIKNNGKPTKY